MSIMIIIEKYGVTDVLILGKGEGGEKNSMEIYTKIEPEIDSFKQEVGNKLGINNSLDAAEG